MNTPNSLAALQSTELRAVFDALQAARRIIYSLLLIAVVLIWIAFQRKFTLGEADERQMVS